MKRIISLAIAVVMVVGLVGVSTSSAATVEELQAQINQLLALISQLQSNSSAPVASATFTRDLTIGSSGSDVSSLQQVLIGGGYLNIVAPTGYFGAMTKAALVKWQSANGVTPASGYFGPLTRASMAPVSTTPSTPTTPTTPVVTTPGAEGTLTVSTNPTPGSGLTIREGDVQKAVLGLKLEAKLSDINVQRVKVDLNTSTVFYNKLFKHIYVMDGSTILAESDLNSSTVVKEGTTYYITLTGFNLIVPKDSVKVLTLALDAMTSIDSTYDAAATYGLAIPANGVRGVDGAGLNQTGPSSAITRRTVTVDADALVDAATLAISKNTNSPVAQVVIASDGTSNNEKDAVTLLTFNLRGAKDDLTVTDLVATIAKTGSGAATATTAYLYDGSTVIGSASVTNPTGVATFSDIDYVVPAGATKTLSLKADIRSADSTASVVTASITAANVTTENSAGTAITPTGSATGEALSFRSAGAEITMKSKSISAVRVDNGAGHGTTTVTAVFKINIAALGDDLLLGKEASTSPIFASSTNYFVLYQGDTATVLTPSSLTFTIGETNTTVSGQTATLPDEADADVEATVSFISATSAGAVAMTAGNYSVGIAGVSTTVDGSTATRDTFMATKTAWRTSSVAVSANN